MTKKKKGGRSVGGGGGGVGAEKLCCMLTDSDAECAVADVETLLSECLDSLTAWCGPDLACASRFARAVKSSLSCTRPVYLVLTCHIVERCWFC